MPSSRNRKEIAQKYRQNLDYFKKPHYLRTLKKLVAVLAILLSAGGIALFFQYGSPQFYSPGPISKNHSHIANNCASCHEDGQGRIKAQIGQLTESAFQTAHEAVKDLDLNDLPKSLNLGKLGLSTADLAHLKAGLQKAAENSVKELAGGAITFANTKIQVVNYAKIDQACLQCHEGFDLHQPSLATVAAKDFRTSMAVAHAGSCATCHFEHAGSGPMNIPTSATCVTCHGNVDRMARETITVPLEGTRAAETGTSGIVRQLGDDTHRFISPQRPAVVPVALTKFEENHPKFDYERPELRDPSTLKFNHRRHLQADIIAPNGKPLDCNSCHRPVQSGEFYRPPTFAESCQQCHSLQFDPQNPEIHIPHRDADKVRAFLHSLSYQFYLVAEERKAKGDETAYQWREEQVNNLKTRVARGEDIKDTVFYTENPYRVVSNEAPTKRRADFPGCAYCHEVKKDGQGLAQITKPITTDRWLSHGRFTHVRHGNMSCQECHHVENSQATADINLPTQESCAKCHREPTLVHGKQEGGATTDCLSCHSFHSTVTARFNRNQDTSLRALLLKPDAEADAAPAE